MSQLCVITQKQSLFHHVTRAPASLEFAGTPWMTEHFQRYERLRGFPTFATIWDVMQNRRHIVFEPHGGVYDQLNVTEAMCRGEWHNISPDTFRKLNIIRTLTGEKLQRLLTAIFQDNLIKKDFYYCAGDYFILEHNRAPVCWIFKQSECWGEDLPSLWAHLYQESYVYAIHHIHRHLSEHEVADDFNRDDKKGYWKPELTALALDTHAPYRFYSPIAIGGASVFNYFRNGILVGCSCSIPHDTHGELTTFFSLMRHTKTQLLRWFPLYPETCLFFQDDLADESQNSVLFMPDENAALEEASKPGLKSPWLGGFSPPVPLACPGGLNRLHTVDVSITSGKRVHIVVPETLHDDEPFMSRLEQKFSSAGAKSLQFYRAGKRWPQEFRKAEFALATKSLASDAGKGITRPGEKIPGADIIRKKVLYPLIESGQLIWIYGPEKSGKSWLARSMAHVISYGGILLGKYEAASDLEVLYIDSEMEPDKLDKAADKELKGLGFTDGVKFFRKVARAEDNPSGEINLHDPEWQAWFNAVLSKYDVIFLDCYYSLTGSSTMPKELLKLLTPWKSKGKTFIVVDHTNRDGELQGGLDKKRAADLCIEVMPDEGECVEISFPTVRHLGSEDTQPFTLRRVFQSDSFHFEPVGEQKPKAALPLPELRAALAYVWEESKELKPADLAGYLGYSESSVYDWVKKVKERQGHKGGTAPEFAAFLAQIERYDDFIEAELIEEAYRLAKT